MSNLQVVFPKTRTTVQLRDGEMEIFYHTSINIDALHALARKAARNKSHRSSLGPLVVELLGSPKKAGPA